MQKAASKDIVAVTIKNETRKALEHQLARLALYVMYIADDNEAILISSGYSLTKTPSPQKIDYAGNVMLRSGGNSGQMIAKIKAVKGTKSYLFEILANAGVPGIQSCKIVKPRKPPSGL